VFKLKLHVRPKSANNLRLIRFWLRKLSSNRVHFNHALTHAHFLNAAFVEALFPNEERESIFISLGDFQIHNLQKCVLPSIAQLTRIQTLHYNLSHFVGNLRTLFTELLLASKQGVSKVLFSSKALINTRNLTEVFLYQLFLLKLSLNIYLLISFRFLASWSLRSSSDYPPK
jgi:hypothetical protein